MPELQLASSHAALAALVVLSDWAIRLGMLVVVPNRRSPEAAKGWLIFVMVLPWIGLLVYLVIGRPSLPKWRLDRFERFPTALAPIRTRLQALPAPALPQIPATQRAYVRLIGDRHGEPPLITDHTVPAIPDPSDTEAWAALDALDWYGLWRPLDALLTCTWSGVDCDLALGDSPQRTFMGTWSDGVPVAPAVVVPDPGPPSVPNPIPRG